MNNYTLDTYGHNTKIELKKLKIAKKLKEIASSVGNWIRKFKAIFQHLIYTPHLTFKNVHMYFMIKKSLKCLM